MRKVGKNFVITIPIYNVSVMFSLGERPQDLEKKLKRWGVDTTTCLLWKLPETTKARAIQFKNSTQLLIMGVIPKTPSDYGTLAHELFHVVTMLLDRLNAPLEMNKNDECYAYLLGWLTEQVYKKL